jgi:arylsulfatase A-like enzyme
MWDTEGPGLGLNGSASCSQSNQAGCTYQDEVFVQRVSQIIANHSKAPAAPLFLFWAPHAPHDPYQVPQNYLDKFANISVPERQYYAAMTNLLDDNVGRVVQMFKDAGLWENTLMVLSSDNGGPEGSGYGGNNVSARGWAAPLPSPRGRARAAIHAPRTHRPAPPAVSSLRRKGK